MAIIGVYGVLSYAVGQRRREVSIRVALGARPNQVKSLFVRRGALLACIGSILGVGAAIGLSRWISSLLFGVTALDPATYAASAFVVCAAALAASYLPAHRASAWTLSTPCEWIDKTPSRLRIHFDGFVAKP